MHQKSKREIFFYVKIKGKEKEMQTPNRCQTTTNNKRQMRETL